MKRTFEKNPEKTGDEAIEAKAWVSAPKGHRASCFLMGMMGRGWG